MPDKTRQVAHVPPLWVRCAVVSHIRTLFNFDVAARHALHVVFEYFQHLVHPAHVHTLCEIRPLIRTRRMYEPAMLGGQAE